MLLFVMGIYRNVRPECCSISLASILFCVYEACAHIHYMKCVGLAQSQCANSLEDVEVVYIICITGMQSLVAMYTNMHVVSHLDTHQLAAI